MHTKILTEMVKIPSTYPHESALCNYMFDYLKNHGFVVELQVVENDRRNILASKGSGGQAILFYGHLDTIPLVDPNDWDTDPFQLTNIDGNLFGLGAYDMKGGITAFVDACTNSDSYIKIFLSVDEENWSKGVWKAIKERSEFFNDVELIISAEPNFQHGLHGITNERTGRYLYNVIFNGKSAHVAQYHEGADAINLLGRFITDFYSRREQLFHNTGSFAQIREVNASAIGMSICGQAIAEVEVLASHTDTLAIVRDKIQSLTDAIVILKDRPTQYLSGYYFPSFPHQQVIANIVQRNTGNKLELTSRKSVADDNALATLGIPVITWGPDGSNAHSANEYVTKSSLFLLNHMYKELLHSRSNP